MRVPKLPEGLDREIRLLGGAAPLSSRKTGYLLRVAHMIPIIFPALRGRDTAHQGLYSMASLASLDSQMHGNNYIFFHVNRVLATFNELGILVRSSKCILKIKFFLHNASPKMARGPRPGNPSTGRGGAPKF